MSNTLDELIEKIAGRFDPDEIVEALDLSTEEILEQFPERLEEKREKFHDELEEEESFLRITGEAGEEIGDEGGDF